VDERRSSLSSSYPKHLTGKITQEQLRDGLGSSGKVITFLARAWMFAEG
jgi:hypothetical protein